MKRAYRVKIEEISVKSVIVYAEDHYEADEIASSLWNDGEIVLTADDFVEMNLVSTKRATEDDMQQFEVVNEMEKIMENTTPKLISLDNGIHFMTAEECINHLYEQFSYEDAKTKWDVIVNCMDDDIREVVHDKVSPCIEADFLAEYLKVADDDLIIG